jgi:uncharacterized protein
MDETTKFEPLHRKASLRYAKWLWLCSGLFAFRVVAQLLSLLFKTNSLPTFESWHGGVLPYPLLLGTQILILIWLARTARLFSQGSIYPRRRLGMAIIIFASLYFLVTLLRLLLGLTILSEHRWFASYLPAFFHLVLASYLFLYGRFHCHYGK